MSWRLLSSSPISFRSTSACATRRSSMSLLWCRRWGCCSFSSSSSSSSSPARLFAPSLFSNRVAVVFGGTGGIGKSIATQLYMLGASVIISGRSQSRCDAAAADIKHKQLLSSSSSSSSVIGVACDLSEPTSITNFVSTLTTITPTPSCHLTSSSSSLIPLPLGRLDFLIHAAGMNVDGLLARQSPAHIQQQLAVNLHAPILTTKLLLPLLLRSTSSATTRPSSSSFSPSASSSSSSSSSRSTIGKDGPTLTSEDGNDFVSDAGDDSSSENVYENGGRIIFIGSVVGSGGNSGQSIYAASKAGLQGFSRSLSKEVGRRSVTVNVVAPGYTETAMTAPLSPQIKQLVLQQSSLHRFAKPEEISNLVCYLCSPAASFITGQVLTIDGGLRL